MIVKTAVRIPPTIMPQTKASNLDIPSSLAKLHRPNFDLFREPPNQLQQLRKGEPRDLFVTQ